MSKRTKNLRIFLLVGIGALLVATALLKRHINARKIEAQANRPEVRLQRANDEARMAMLSGQFAEAAAHLKEARGIVEEALTVQPGARKLLAARLTLARRYAQTRQRAGLEPEPTEVEEISRLSAELLAAFPNDESARRVRIEVALEAAEQPDKAAARAALRAGLEEVEATIVGLKPADSVRSGLGKGWLRLAEMAEEAKDAALVDAALARVVVHGAALAQGDDPVSGLRAQHTLLSQAAQIARRMERPTFPKLMEDLIALLKIKRRLQGDKGNLSSLAYWVGIAGDEAEGDEARTTRYEEAMALREALLKVEPEVEHFIDSLRMMNRVAIFHGKAKRFEQARATYERALSLSAPSQDPKVQALRLFVMDNLCRLLDRHDKMVEAKAQAQAAYDLGRLLRRAHPDDPVVQLRAAAAGLRQARLMSVRPKPQPRAALKLAREMKAEAQGIKEGGARLKKLHERLDALIKALK